MAGHEGLGVFGPQGERPYLGSGPSGSSDTEAGLAQLEALRYVDVDAPQDTPPPTAAELRESLREITNSTKPSESTGPRNRDQILASLHGETDTDGAPVSSLSATEVPPTVAEINTKSG